MCWNPPDPSDYIQQRLSMYEDEDDLEITYLVLPDGDPYEIRVFHPDGTPTIEEFWSADDFYARVEDLKQAQVEYEVVFGPEEIPF